METIELYMPGSSIAKEMMKYFMQLTDAEKKSVLQLLKTFISSRKNDSKPVTIDEYNLELDQASAEIEAGDFVLHEDVMKLFAKKK